MMDFDVGVSKPEAHVVTRVDADYLSEEQGWPDSSEDLAMSRHFPQLWACSRLRLLALSFLIICSAYPVHAGGTAHTAAPPTQEHALELSPTDLFAQTVPGVVQVLAYDQDLEPIGQGSGFFVSEDGLVATNHHVVAAAFNAFVVTGNDATYPIEGLAASDPDCDLALVKINVSDAVWLRLSDAALPPVGTTVYAIGNPEGLKNTLSQGLVSGHRVIGGVLTLIQTTAAIGPGSSGGPLLAPDGTVVGVTTSGLASGQNLNFAIPSTQLLRLMKSQGELKKLPGGTRAFRADTPRPAKRIGVSLLTVQHQFYQDLRAGLEDEAAKHGYKLLVTTAEFDSARQANQIDEFIVQRVSAIVVCPCDSRRVGASIAASNYADIPVFTADIASMSPLGKVVAHIASDNKEGGRKAAKLLVEALGGKGKVVILSHPDVTCVMDRVAGFKEEIAKHAGVEVVAELSAEGMRDKAARVMEDLLQSHPDVNGVFGINDDSALGALAAVEAAGKLGQIKIVGYDATPEARAKIEAGAIYGDVIQNPRRIGQLTIQTIHDVFGGKTPPAVIPIEVGTFTGYKVSR